ncbi:MAG TPA: hypothetical protein VF677_10855 [Flavobacterium sp.]|jgi:hypothetical protein
MVSEELMNQYLKRIEIEKTNMIQYIGDIRYTQKEHDPCGYSKITIKDEGDTERNALVIFDEDDTTNPIDRTANVFGIVAGDERKNISITLDQLKTKGVLCQGLLLETGQKHSEQKNVFQLDRVMPALREKNGVYIVVQDPGQQGDTDVRPDTARGTSGDVSEAQRWTEGTDYKFEGENKMLIMPKYVYNKTALENIQVYSSSPAANNVINTLWLFNYFLLTEDKAQTYFLPISTCRYPNQIAKIKVYPDIEWEIAFMITIGTGYSGKIKYSRERMNGYHQNYGFRYLKDELQIEGTQTNNLGWALKAKAVENGKEHEIGIESIKKVVDTAVGAFNTTRQYLEMFNPENNDGTPSLAQSQRVIEIDFAIDPPNIGFALGWKFDKASNDEIVPIYTGGLRADPLIGLTIAVDLVPLIKFLGPVGRIINWIIRFIQWMSRSQLYITFEVALPVKADLSISYNKVDGFKNKGKQKIWIEPGVTFRAGCKSNEVVMISTVTRGGITETTEVEKWKVEGNVATSFNFEKEWGYDLNANKYYEQSNVRFNGAKMTIIISNLISNRRIDFKPYKQETFELIAPDSPTDPLYTSGKIYID